MKNKILLSSAVIAGMTLLASSTFAASNTLTGGLKANLGNGFVQSSIGFGLNLTDAEKTSLESMTDEQKKAFMETKRLELEAKFEARETVIDKLLAGTTLTATEETLRQEIIKERAEQKTKRAEMKAQKEKIKAILEKKKAGTTLTAEEQALLDSSWKQHGGRDKGGKRGGGGWGR